MNAASAQRWYLSALFVLLVSNVLSASLAALGIRGFAFYHVQAVILILVGAQFCLLLLDGQIRRTIDPTLWSLLLGSIAYSGVSALFLLRFADVSPAFVALMLHTLLFYPVTALIMLGCVRSGDRKATMSVPRWLPWAAVAVVAFGWVQYAVGTPIIEIVNGENISKLVEMNLLGTFRPPSVFESSFQFGLFSVLLFSLASAHALFGTRRKWAWMLAVIGLSGALLSQTRNVYLCVACCTVSLWLLMRLRRRRNTIRMLRLAPFAYAMGALGLMIYAIANFLGSNMTATEDLADASSTWARVSSWQSAWENLVLPSSLLDSLFGFGITQAGHASDYLNLYPARGSDLFIDSTFVNLFLLQGLAGLLMFLCLWWCVWQRLLHRTQQDFDPLTAGTTAFCSTFLAAGMFNILTGVWWGITLSLAMISISNTKYEVGSRQLCEA